jgi:nucleoside-diphosphate-sugar epimerase
MTQGALTARAYEGKSVLVTGGTGFIGTHLSRRLAAHGAEVVVFGRHAGKPDAGVKLVLGDVRSETSVNALIGRGFDYVFNLAAYSGQVPSFTDHEQSLTTNCLGHLNLLEAIRTLSPDTIMCFASSRLVYGRTRYLPVDEDHPKEARSFYGIHKRTCEEYCEYYALRFGVRSVALRLANPYGPHDPAGHHRYNIANWMIDELTARREVTVFGRGEQLRDYIYIDDAVDAMLHAAIDPKTAGRVYNVGSGSGTALIDFVRTVIGAAAGGSYKLVEWPQEFLQVETGDYAADITRIEAELGWRPRVSLAAGIAMTVAASDVASQRGAAPGRAAVPGSDAEPEHDAKTLRRAA